MAGQDYSELFGELLDDTQSKLRVWPAILGDGSGNVVVPNLVKRVYVRMPDGHAAIVYNDDRVPLTNDLPVVVGYDYINPRLFQVLGIRQTYRSQESQGYSSLGMHHESHEWLADHGGQDVVFSQARQLLPDRLTPVTGLTVGVYNTPIETTTGWKSAALWTLDLTTHVPGSGARYVLVYQNLDGSLSAVDGATVANRTLLRWENIPASTAGKRALAAIALQAGQTAFDETRDRQDIVDLRFVNSIDAPWSHVGASGSAAHPTTSASASGFAPALPGDAQLFLNGLGSWTSGSSGSVPTSRLINTTAPLAGGGALSADLTLAISAATSGSAGSMSAADKAKLDGITGGATNTPLSSATPANIGTAAAGTSGSASRGDHVHDDLHWLDVNRYGFVLNADGSQQTTLAFDGTNTVTLAPASGSAGTWSYYRAGVKHTITGSKTIVLSGSPPAAKALYYIFINATDGTLTVSPAAWTLEDTKVPVCAVVWDNTLTPKYWLADERHSCLIDRRFHWEHHFSDGTEVISAAALTGPNVAPSSPLDTDNTLAISEAVTSDEDIKHILAQLTNPDAVTAKYVVFYRTGAGVWKWEASIMPYRYTAAGYIQYDNAGTMAQVSDNYYVNTYLLLTNLGDNGAARFVFVHGQAQYANLAAAQGEKFSSMVKTGLPVGEYVAVYQFTWSAKNAYGTSGKCRLAASPVSISVSATGFGGFAADHNGLTNLQGGTAGEYYHLTAAQNTLAGKLGDSITAGKVLTFAAADSYTLTIPATGTVALLGAANVFTQAQQISETTSPFVLDAEYLAGGDCVIRLTAYGGANYYRGQRINGTPLSKSAVSLGNGLAILSGTGWSGTQEKQAGTVSVEVDGTVTSSAVPGSVKIGTVNTSDVWSLVGYFTSQRQVVLGTPYAAPGYSLATSLYAYHPSVTSPSVIYSAAAGAIFRSENAELAFGRDNASPYGYWMQAREGVALRLAINPLGGPVGIGTANAAAALAVNGGLHVGGDSDPGDNNFIVDGTATITGAFGCNAKTAQTAYASGGDITPGAGAYGASSADNFAAMVTLVRNIRSALVANGILS